MGRPIRYHYPGCFYHVMLRGNDGKDIFFSNRDRHNILVPIECSWFFFRKIILVQLGKADCEGAPCLINRGDAAELK